MSAIECLPSSIQLICLEPIFVVTKTKTANDLQCCCCISFFCVSTIDFVTLETLKEQDKHQFRAILINAQELKTMQKKNKKKK